MNPPTPILEAKGLEKYFLTPEKLFILKDISLTVYPKETLAILGPSGVGKSTLLNILGSLERSSQGTLHINGKDLYKSDIHKIRNEEIGFIFQSYHLLEEYSALDNVLMPAKIGGKSVKKGSPALLRALMLLELVGMSHRLHFLAKNLSGGEKQRISIARALCNDPSLILADEPTGNLDDQNSSSIHKLLISCAKEFGKGLIVVTHNQELANRCDKQFVLKKGLLEYIR